MVTTSRIDQLTLDEQLASSPTDEWFWPWLLTDELPVNSRVVVCRSGACGPERYDHHPGTG